MLNLHNLNDFLHDTHTHTHNYKNHAFYYIKILKINFCISYILCYILLLLYKVSLIQL